MPHPSLPPLSEAERKCIEFLSQRENNSELPPSLREISKATQIKAISHVSTALDSLELKGYIQRQRRKARSMQVLIPVLPPGQSQPQKSFIAPAPAQVFSIPLYGTITAGLPGEFPIDRAADPSRQTVEDPDSGISYVQVLQSQLPLQTDPTDLYALRVIGDSMMDALVNNGDIIIRRQTHAFINGDMVAVSLDDFESTTFKRIYEEPYKKGKRIRLQPANSNYPPIYVRPPHTVQVIAKMVMVFREC